MFKTGDSVKCINNEYYESQLVIGKVYTVERVDSDGYVKINEEVTTMKDFLIGIAIVLFLSIDWAELILG